MTIDSSSTAFVRHLKTKALNSAAVKHPYIHALHRGDLPDMKAAFKDFAFQYGLYSRHFVEYLSAVIGQLSSAVHKQTLQHNLAEETGNAHDADLPPHILASVDGKTHSYLYMRFQDAIGADKHYRETTPPCKTAELWSAQFLQLCQTNEYVGIGAIGIGTELLVSEIYSQLLEGLKVHSELSIEQRVFFDLHAECDQEHANQMLQITEDLAQNQAAREQIEFGVNMALQLRILFWDKMLERARLYNTHEQTHPARLTLV